MIIYIDRDLALVKTEAEPENDFMDQHPAVRGMNDTGQYIVELMHAETVCSDARSAGFVAIMQNSWPPRA